MTGQLVSAEATGGAGPSYEHRVAAIMLGRLLRGAHMPAGPERPIHRIGFQRRNAGFPLDDFVAHSLPRDDGAPETAVQFQVKRTIRLSASDNHFRTVIAAAVSSCQERPTDVRSGRLLFGLAVAEPEAGLTDLGKLAQRARSHEEAKDFVEALSPGSVAESRRALYGHVFDAVEIAAGGAANPVALSHLLLARLHVWRVSTDDDGATWRDELDGLSDLATQAGLAASDLLGMLYKLAAIFDQEGGTVGTALLHQQLFSKFGVSLGRPGVQGPSNPQINVHGNGPSFNNIGTQVFPNLSFGDPLGGRTGGS
jgi:hypothetical protein